MNFNMLLEIFAREMALEELVPDEQGGYQVEIDDMFIVTCLPKGSKEMLLTVLLAVLPDNKSEEDALLTRLMERNLAWTGEQAGVLSVAPDSDNIVFHRLLDISSKTVAEFVDIFEEFVNCAERWHLTIHEKPPSLPGFPGLFP